VIASGTATDFAIVPRDPTAFRLPSRPQDEASWEVAMDIGQIERVIEIEPLTEPIGVPEGPTREEPEPAEPQAAPA